MYCENCGEKLKEGAEVCLKCGHQAKKETKTNTKFNEQNIPSEYKPISMWGYFGYEILFMIPIIGFILLLVFALGGTSNKNLKNFARSYFCLFIIIAVIFVIIALMGAATASSLYY